jgi:hypothetical protein
VRLRPARRRYPEGGRPVAHELFAGAVTVFGGALLVDQRGKPATVSLRSARLVSSRRVGLMPVARMKQK